MRMCPYLESDVLGRSSEWAAAAGTCLHAEVRIVFMLKPWSILEPFLS